MGWVLVDEGFFVQGWEGRCGLGERREKGWWGDVAGGQTGGRFCFLSGELKEGGFVGRVD